MDIAHRVRHAVRDTALVDGTVLRFTVESAEHMKPWLLAWRARRPTPAVNAPPKRPP
jgi:hypothetical protein